MNQSDFISPYIPNTESDRQAMLSQIGVSDLDELFADIPEQFRNPKLALPEPKSEFELMSYIQQLVSMNKVPGEYSCFLGAGSYRHYIPAVVRSLTSRGEYVTSYTPYQPEVSQGTLQTEFEFQTLCALLTGMEVANAGMYDGSTSFAEGALMAARITKRNHIVILDSVSPAYIEVLETYTKALDGIEIEVLSLDNLSKIDKDTACILAQQPNFYGYLEDMQKIADIAHDNGSLFVVYADPFSMTFFEPPGSLGADVVVAEAQSMGVAPIFGGPYVGIFACKQKHIRQMPGRIVGKTLDQDGREAYVLTLQTREQHIRRERATSNICTSVALIALMTTIFMATNGKKGMKHIGELIYHKAHYLSNLISNLPGFSFPIKGTFYQEFVVQTPISPRIINEKLLDYKIIGGLDISKYVNNGMLICASELNSIEEINSFVDALAEITSKPISEN